MTYTVIATAQFASIEEGSGLQYTGIVANSRTEAIKKAKRTNSLRVSNMKGSGRITWTAITER